MCWWRSNSAGFFSGFLVDPVEIYGVEPLGKGVKLGDHAASLMFGTEGIIPAIESSHAVAYAIELAKKMQRGSILVCLSGCGDKDMDYVIEQFGMRKQRLASHFCDTSFFF